MGNNHVIGPQEFNIVKEFNMINCRRQTILVWGEASESRGSMGEVIYMCFININIYVYIYFNFLGS